MGQVLLSVENYLATSAPRRQLTMIEVAVEHQLAFLADKSSILFYTINRVCKMMVIYLPVWPSLSIPNKLAYQGLQLTNPSYRLQHI